MASQRPCDCIPTVSTWKSNLLFVLTKVLQPLPFSHCISPLLNLSFLPTAPLNCIRDVLAQDTTISLFNPLRASDVPLS